MRIFFSANPKSKQEIPVFIDRIYAFLRKNSHTLTEKILEKTSYHAFTKWNSADHEKNYKNTIEAISSADICVFEASLPSIELAHFINQALDHDKPTVILTREGTTPFMLEHASEQAIILIEYTERDLERELAYGIKEANEQPRGIRFNCLISAELNRYLERAAHDNSMSKSGFVRKLIREHQKNS